MLVADGELQLCGIFTDGDLRRTLQQCGEAGRDIMRLKVEEAMCRRPKTCSSDQMAIDAMQVGLRGWGVLRAVVCEHGVPMCGAHVWVGRRVGAPRKRQLRWRHAVPCYLAMSRPSPSACSATEPSPACLPPLQSMEAGPKVTVLPVVDSGRLQGLVTLHDLVSAGL